MTAASLMATDGAPNGAAAPRPMEARLPVLDRQGVVTAARRPRWGQIAASLVLLVLLAAFVWTLAVNKNMHWDVVAAYLFHPLILKGVAATLELTVLAVLIALVAGVVLAAMGQSRNPVLSTFAAFYIWLFRALPLLVQLVLWFNLALLFPEIGIGIPGTAIYIGWNTNHVITPFIAAILALAMHEAAYMAEIVRSGILAVPSGQTEAALTIGMTRGEALRRIVLPQALRVIIPPIGNQFIMVLKASALVSVIGGGDLLTSAQNLYAINYEVIALLLVASIWYMAIISITSVGQHYLEKRLSRSERHGGGGRVAQPVETEV